MYDAPNKGENKDKYVEILWQDDFSTSSRFIYYGKGTRNEYRVTRFGKGFPFLNDENIGDLFILLKVSDSHYKAYVLSTEDQIETFLSTFELSPVDTNSIIDVNKTVEPEGNILACYNEFIKNLKVDFPTTRILASQSRICYNRAFNIDEQYITSHPDRILVNWISSEYELFKTIEQSRYSHYLTKPFNSIEDLVSTANTILNRRKSRAGASLELHLEEIFLKSKLDFTAQATTEGRKKPDFIFPSEKSYHNKNLSSDSLVMLAAKTTCKDRWRQILNEANRIEVKHLFTLQQGISSNQLEEMKKEKVQLVVPSEYIKTFPVEYRSEIMTLGGFIRYVKK